VRGVKIMTLLTTVFSQTVGLTRKFVFANVSFIFLYTIFSKYFTLHYVFSWYGLISGPSEIINGTNRKINVKPYIRIIVNWKSRRNLRRQYVEAECEMQDHFTHRQHSEGVRFIAPRKPQCPESYRVRDNGRTVTVQLHFSDR